MLSKSDNPDSSLDDSPHQPKTYQIMKTRQRPITEPRMMVSRLFLRLILFTKLLIRGNLLDRSFSLV